MQPRQLQHSDPWDLDELYNPVNKASYSALLLVKGNLSWTPYLRTFFFQGK